MGTLGTEKCKCIRLKLEQLEGLLSTEIGEVYYFKSYIRSTLQLFDGDERMNYKRIYRSIKKCSDKCRKQLKQNSHCSNPKCKKSAMDCKYICSGCESALYCSKRCQKYDWSRGEHHNICRHLRL